MADYSSLDLDECRSILAPYGLDSDEVKPLPGGAANSSFVAKVNGVPIVVVTVLDNHSPATTDRLAALTDWLISSEVPTPPILRDSTGNPYSLLKGKPVVVRPFVPGDQPERLSGAQIAEVGRVLRHLHSLSPPEGIDLPNRRLPSDWRSQLKEDAPADLVHQLEAAETYSDPNDGLGPRLIHGDLFPDNMIWMEQGSLQVLDWETASIDSPALDLGYAAAGIAGDGQLKEADERSLLHGYRWGCDEASLAVFRNATHYAGAVLMFHRYLRHAVRFPNPSLTTYWRRLTPLMLQMAPPSK